jgi:hypothetical protein
MKLNLHVKDSPHGKKLPRLFLLATSMAIACAGSIAMPSRAHAGINSVARQDVKITGVVTDEKGETLPGVTVSLKGSQTAVVTDVNGKFTLNIPDASGTLVFTYIGYVKQEVAINGQTTFNIKLEADSKSLNEVVVVGYGTKRKQP